MELDPNEADLDLPALKDSWILHLRAERKSANTIRSYTNSINMFVAWCDDEGHPYSLDRTTVRLFIVATLDSGRTPATAGARHLALRRFSDWLASEGEIDHDDLITLKAPKLEKAFVIPYTDDEMRRLYAACQGKDFLERRDEALARFIRATGARAGETVGIDLGDMHIKEGKALVRRGKGGKTRWVSFGSKTAIALDRYLRMRRRHKKAAESTKFWLGGQNQTFGYQGLWAALGRRATQAGLADFHPHRLRHTWADEWLEKGGSRDGLMAAAGWERMEMLLHYTKGRQQARAVEEAQRLGLGEL